MSIKREHKRGRNRETEISREDEKRGRKRDEKEEMGREERK